MLSAAGRAGVLDIIADSEWRRRRLAIFGYHSVAVDEEHKWRRSLFFTAPELEQRFLLFQRWRLPVLPLAEAVDRLRAGTLPPRSAVLTFDDGSADFASIVWPMLRRFGYPATVYASTYYSEKRHPIFHLMCSYLLWKGRHRVIEPSSILGIPTATNLSNPKDRYAAERRIIEQADRDQLSADERNARAACLSELVGVVYEDLLRRRVLQLMTPDEMRRVAADGADVQLHTHRHRAPRVPDLLAREIRDNRNRLEALTGRRAEHFCYPLGIYFTELLPVLTAQGVVTAVTCRPGLATPASQALLLPRVIDTAGLTSHELAGWFSGAGQALHL